MGTTLKVYKSGNEKIEAILRHNVQPIGGRGVEKNMFNAPWRHLSGTTGAMKNYKNASINHPFGRKDQLKPLGFYHWFLTTLPESQTTQKNTHLF